MAQIKFSFPTSLSAEEFMTVMTDFSPARVDRWPSINANQFVVHELGDTWAEVNEGTDGAWERARYAWDAATSRVEITTLDSKLFGAGGGWVFQYSADADGGGKIDVELARHPRTIKGKVLAALLPLIGPASLKKSFAVPLAAR